MFNSDTLAGMLLSILIRLAANPHHGHVEQLGLELALLVVQILLVFVFPAHPVQTLPEGEVAEILVLAAGVVAHVVLVAAHAELLLHVQQRVLRVVEYHVERTTSVAGPNMFLFGPQELLTPWTFEVAIFFNCVVHKLFKLLHSLQPVRNHWKDLIKVHLGRAQGFLDVFQEATCLILSQ